MYIIKYNPHTQKDLKKLKRIGLNNKTKKLIDIIVNNPFQNPPLIDFYNYNNICYNCSKNKFYIFLHLN
jgi:Txe/YoeB family toxin of Txe-Axe toxin-antitoxin module